MLIQTLIINVWLGRTVPDLWEVMSSRSCRPSSRRLSFRALWLSTLSLKLYTHVNTKTTCQRKGNNLGSFFFSSFTLSFLFGFSSYFPLEHLHTQMHTKKCHHSSNRRIQMLLFHCSMELMGEFPILPKEKIKPVFRNTNFFHCFHDN